MYVLLSITKIVGPLKSAGCGLSTIRVDISAVILHKVSKEWKKWIQIGGSVRATG